MAVTKSVVTVKDITNSIEAIAPTYLAESWDNVGLLVGDNAWPVERVLLTIDLTEHVLDEAVKQKADMIIAYHPPIFHAIKTLTDDNPTARIALRSAAEKIAIYSPHTAIDAAPGGINDWLAEGMGSGDVRALTPFESLPPAEENKVITFCPADAVERLRNGLSAIGAGQIGKYQLCSFETKGVGTFHASEDARPTVGKTGQLERVDEVRLEMVCSTRSLALAVTTIRQLHPYEQPPIDIIPLRARPKRAAGQGRRVMLDHAVDLDTLIDRIRKTVGSERVVASIGDGSPKKYEIIGVCAGAGASLMEIAIAEGCQLFFTGEMRHHDVLAGKSRGCTVVLAGHTNTERGYLKILKKRLVSLVSDVKFTVSKRDADPLTLM